ncbi:MAG: GNAT family N-acetyltransferase [Actinobacteria bacterium]|nr:GNAT family N-acetyltransferase [Actinomycetota bacterium]
MSWGTTEATTSTVAVRDLDLAQALDDHFRLQVLAFGHVTPSGDGVVSDHAVMAQCGGPSVFNRATALDLEQPDLAVAEVQHFFGDLPHTLWLRDDRVDEDVDRLLRTRGYVPLTPVSGMALELPASDLPVRDSHRVQLLTDPSLAERLASVASTSFGFGRSDRLVFEDLARNVLRHARPYQHGAVYGAPYGSEIVAMGLLLCTADLAGISTIATAPLHRRRGLATAVITRALNDAAALGYRVAGVVTNPDSGRLMAELGFEEALAYRVYRQVAR